MRKRIKVGMCVVILSMAACGGDGPVTPRGNSVGIGPEGGTLTSADGAAKLVIPAGALTQKTAITLVAAPAGDLPLDAAALRGQSYAVAADVNFSLAAPATLEITYDPASGPLGVPETSYGIHRVQNGEWAFVQGATVDAAGNVATASITGPGVFGVRRQEPTAPCADAAFRQFDFWIGEWTILPNVPSSVTRETSGCAIFEHYRPTGLEAKSISIYDPRDGRWHQTYIVKGNTGQPLLMTGGLEGDKMVMYVRSGGSITQRWTWERIDANTVTQKSERTTDNGATYTLGFLGTYKRR